MSHWIVVPFVLPAVTACGLVLLGSRPGLQRAVSLAAALVLLGVTVWLATRTQGGAVHVYAMGDWPAHIGIVFVLDALSALMLVLTATVAVASLWYATRGWDARGRHFHALFQFQLMGLNGAFLTGDLFNLFVCFELMLIASYGLLQHGGGPARRKAGIHYVVLNLVGSTLFLVAVSLLYRVAGTLNMADLALALAHAPDVHGPWVRAGALLLMVVFLLKGAIAPLYLWLPGTYRAASAPVAAIFSVLTKVGGYAVLRVGGIVFGDNAATEAIHAVVMPLALATVAVAAAGAIGSHCLGQLAAWLALGSSGTSVAAVGLFSENGVGGGLFYLVASTLGVAALFLLADAIRDARGSSADELRRAPRMHGAGGLALLFFVVATAVAGMPPLAGFLGKALILRGAGPLPWLWGVLLIASLFNLLSLARAGSRLFWSVSDERCDGQPAAAAWSRLLPIAALSVAIAAMTLAAGPVERFTRRAAAGVVEPARYVGEVLRASPGRWLPSPGAHAAEGETP
jgi:multicomponent K+:H+ antiporter subunit D